jgi:SNF2 family DNA or RNA helicase
MKLKKIYIERTKDEVLKELLPEKHEQLVLCELSLLQKRVYAHVLTLPDIELVRKAQSPCDCGVNTGFFQRLHRLQTPAERLAYYRKHKEDIVQRRQCCYRIPLNPRRDEEGQPQIDPDAAIWRMLDAHDSDEGCKYCPSCCGLPALGKL